MGLTGKTMTSCFYDSSCLASEASEERFRLRTSSIWSTSDGVTTDTPLDVP